MSKRVMKRFTLGLIIAVLMISVTFNIITADKKSERSDAIMVIAFLK